MPRAPLSTAVPNGAPHRLWRWIALAAIAGLLLALVGPFGTWLYKGMAARLIFWITATLAGLVNYGVTLTAVRRRVPPASRAWWPAMLAAALIASVPQALITRGFAFRLWPDLARRDPSWLVWYANTALIGLIATVGILLVLRRAAQPAQPGIAPTAPAEPGLGGRAPASIFALQMEDHYVRIHRPRGSTIELMPMKAAIARYGRSQGLRVHRSWWVARDAIRRVEREGRNWRLVLEGGLVVPVARNSIAQVRMLKAD